MAGRGTARGLMPATHVPGDDFEVDVHLDSAGHELGAWRLAAAHFARRQKMWDCCTKMKMRALKYDKFDTFESVDFEQA